MILGSAFFQVWVALQLSQLVSCFIWILALIPFSECHLCSRDGGTEDTPRHKRICCILPSSSPTRDTVNPMRLKRGCYLLSQCAWFLHRDRSIKSLKAFFFRHSVNVFSMLLQTQICLLCQTCWGGWGSSLHNFPLCAIAKGPRIPK